MWFNFKYRLEMRSGKGGSWSINLLEDSDLVYPRLGRGLEQDKICGVPVVERKNGEGLGFGSAADIANPELGIFVTVFDTDEIETVLKKALRVSSPVGFLVSLVIPDSQDQRTRQLIISALLKSADAVAQQINSITNVLNSLKTTVLLPAGEVFTFNGIDTDKDGNLFSHINYDTPTSGKGTDKYGRPLK
jgi:hypothetical protein